MDNLADEYAILVSGLLNNKAIDSGLIDAAVLSSTVPPLEATFKTVCQRNYQVTPLVVGTGVKTGIRVRYDNPYEVGLGNFIDLKKKFFIGKDKLVNLPKKIT